MRTILAIALLLSLATVPAAARNWSDTPPCNPLALPHEPPPPTDADLIRRENAKHALQDTDDFTQRFGLDHGRADILRYRLDGEPDSEIRAWVDGGGATLQVRW